ncbi:hypothetical protein [Phytoactinopolyspora endophytica]|uniref:hypothetical protein n=1 Tax=Phytoactinopolyspora endophytica TaxID=1642495 RepID=UPI00101CF0DA|nr:hypothetical protein [Phytoactinopolyspora endophytica]
MVRASLTTPTIPIRRGVQAAAVTLIAMLAVAACSDPAPEPLPVRAAVTWQGGVPPSSEHDDDPRVVAVHEYTRWMNASINALNFSAPSLAAVADESEINPTYTRTVRDVRSENGDVALRQGPDVFTVREVVEQQVGTSRVEVCLRPATKWTLDDTDAGDTTETLVGSGIWERRHTGFTVATYTVVQEDDHARVISWSWSPTPCDPGDVTFGVFTEPPDFGLLREARPQMVVDPEGNPTE